MKLSPLLSLLATSQVSLAAPAPSVEAVDITNLPSNISLETRSPSPAHELEQRANGVCQVLDQTIRTIGTSKVIYTTSGTGLALAVCNYAGGQRCGEITYIIQSGLMLAYAAAAHYSGATPEGLPTKRQIDNYLQQWEAMLASYADISRDGESAPTHHRFKITGLSLDDAAKHDIIANHYANGETVLHLPLSDSDNSTEGSSSALEKRFDNPGFKISYTTRTRTKLTQAHQKSMALAGAATWGVYADNAGHKMDDFIGEMAGYL
ncbi:hypothetical protein BJX61DRAFT_544778 [Aspergillus egyptiacus]|nr:hypothetical protein BJX61DRAFT_544778 [Aspergillus egyptiacus]